MASLTPPPLDRCAVHTRTNKPWSLRQCCEAYASRGIGGISVWDDAIESVGAKEARTIIDGNGLRVPAFVRGGFFTAHDQAEQERSLTANRHLLDDASTIGADMLVLVVGATPGLPLGIARQQVTDAIEKLLPHAEATKVRLAIEPLHPMYAADKSCINRIAEARRVCEQLQSDKLGVALDVYHTWWDPDLENEIKLLGETGKIFGFHTCDWRANTRDLLTDRGLMGDGVIDLKGIRGMVEDAGFDGFIEVEIFSEEHWAQDQNEYLDLIVDRFQSAT